MVVGASGAGRLGLWAVLTLLTLLAVLTELEAAAPLRESHRIRLDENLTYFEDTVGACERLLRRVDEALHVAATEIARDDCGIEQLGGVAILGERRRGGEDRREPKSERDPHGASLPNVPADVTPGSAQFDSGTRRKTASGSPAHLRVNYAVEISDP